MSEKDRDEIRINARKKERENAKKSKPDEARDRIFAIGRIIFSLSLSFPARHLDKVSWIYCDDVHSLQRGKGFDRLISSRVLGIDTRLFFCSDFLF